MPGHLTTPLHLGYWALYGLLVTALLWILRLPARDVSPVASLAAAWPILVLAVAPNVVAFYAGYGPLFSRSLARRRFPSLVAWSIGVCLGTGGLGLLLGRVLFGPNQPVFANAGEAAGLALSLAALAGIHLTIALVMRGFVSWYADITVKEELIRKTHETELALVRSRLDPHFLFNTLNNVDVLITRDPHAASRYLNQLSDIIRFVLYESKADAIPLADELGYVEKYFALERIRTRNPRHAGHTVTGDPSGLAIAPMTFLPFIENAFKHAEGVKEDDTIASRITIDGRRIVFECTNRYVPRAAATASAGGLGHGLIRRRLQLLYPGRHALEAGGRDGAYDVRLTIDA